VVREIRSALATRVRFPSPGEARLPSLNRRLGWAELIKRVFATDVLVSLNALVDGRPPAF
jgi:hypothetical protein